MIDLTRRWVLVNSYTDNVAGVNQVGELLREAFALPSLSHEARAGRGCGDHLVWRTAAAGARILMIGHHDTVFPPGHFEGWTEDGGRAIGPGALDMKGGLAVIWGALSVLEELGVLASLPITVVSVADEETGSRDSKEHVVELARGAACALVFESGRANDSIVTRRRGTGNMTVGFDGRAAHAGNAHKEGVNAIWAAARFVDAAQKLTAYDRGLTVNVGLIKGGTSKNTVPAACECQLDLRFETVEDANTLIASLRAAAQEAATSVSGAGFRVEGGANRLPLERTAASAALFEEYRACAEAAGLPTKESPIQGGGSDANTTGAIGVPSIDALGPRGEGFHTRNEYVDLSTFAPKCEALVRFLVGRLAR